MFVSSILVLLICSFGSFSAGDVILNTRENDKICSLWEPLQGTSISYQLSSECIDGPGIEYFPDYSQFRLCCPALPATTIPANIPRECGKQHYTPLGQRIIGGSIANPNSWPWQILLAGPNNMCGGSLIDTQHVLTAAHCITPGAEYVVLIGMHTIQGVRYADQQISAAKIYVHEGYNTQTNENDIAIIYLSRPVEITDKVNLICLPGAEASIGDSVYLSGWGKTAADGDSSPILKQTELQVVDCGTFWAPSQYDANKQICASIVGATPCNGDSGGPLMYQYNGQWHLNGVVSFGSADCRTGAAGVYARVSYYMPWIKEKMSLAGN